MHPQTHSCTASDWQHPPAGKDAKRTSFGYIQNAKLACGQRRNRLLQSSSLWDYIILTANFLPTLHHFLWGCVCVKKTPPAYVRVYTMKKSKLGVCKHILFQHFLTFISLGFQNCLVRGYIQYIHMHTNIYLVCMLRIWKCVHENSAVLSLYFFFPVYFHRSLVIFCLADFCYCNASSNIQNANFLLHKNVIKLSGFLYKQISAGRLMGCCIPSKEEILFNYLPYKIQ